MNKFIELNKKNLKNILTTFKKYLYFYPNINDTRYLNTDFDYI